MTIEISTAAMLTELTITFPALWKRPLSDFGNGYAGQPGVWTGADSCHVMQDGDPIFFAAGIGAPPYNDGPVHEAFNAWLQARGWCWDRYDGDTFFLVPSKTDVCLAAWAEANPAVFTGCATVDADPCPF